MAGRTPREVPAPAAMERTGAGRLRCPRRRLRGGRDARRPRPDLSQTRHHASRRAHVDASWERPPRGPPRRQSRSALSPLASRCGHGSLRGPGTEFRDASAALEPPELLRPEHGGEQSPDFSDGVMRRNQDLEIDRAPGSPHFALGCGEVGLVRGTNWAGADPMRLLHRSPPAMGDTARLLLVIDPVDPMSDEEDVRYPS